MSEFELENAAKRGGGGDWGKQRRGRGCYTQSSSFLSLLFSALLITN